MRGLMIRRVADSDRTTTRQRQRGSTQKDNLRNNLLLISLTGSHLPMNSDWLEENKVKTFGNTLLRT
jgi:hypothetical protein